jgi:hypothetical protein
VLLLLLLLLLVGQSRTVMVWMVLLLVGRVLRLLCGSGCGRLRWLVVVVPWVVARLCSSRLLLIPSGWM